MRRSYQNNLCSKQLHFSRHRGSPMLHLGLDMLSSSCNHIFMCVSLLAAVFMTHLCCRLWPGGASCPSGTVSASSVVAGKPQLRDTPASWLQEQEEATNNNAPSSPCLSVQLDFFFFFFTLIMPFPAHLIPPPPPPSSVSPVFRACFFLKHPLKPRRLWLVWALSLEAMWGWGETGALTQATMTRTFCCVAWNNGSIE